MPVASFSVETMWLFLWPLDTARRRESHRKMVSVLTSER